MGDVAGLPALFDLPKLQMAPTLVQRLHFLTLESPLWSCLMHLNFCPLHRFKSREQRELRLVHPNFSTLEVVLVVRSLEEVGVDRTHTLGKDDIEGLCHSLEQTRLQEQSHPALTTTSREGPNDKPTKPSKMRMTNAFVQQTKTAPQNLPYRVRATQRHLS